MATHGLINPGSLSWIGAIAGFLTRKQPVGGWLLFFLFQLYAGLAIILVNTNWQRFLPGGWGDSRLYLIYALTTLPMLLTLATAVLSGGMLLRTFQWSWVLVMRYVLVIYLLLGVLKLLADSIFFGSLVAYDGATLLSPSIILVYLNLSTRVRRVFGAPEASRS